MNALVFREIPVRLAGIQQEDVPKLLWDTSCLLCVQFAFSVTWNLERNLIIFFLLFCDRLATAMSDIESDPQFTVLLDDLEASGAKNSDSYSDISVTSVYTCDLIDFDEDSSDSDSDKCA